MRVFVAGASGALGRRLLPLLVGAGHEVCGMTRSGAKAGELQALGATAVVCDALDGQALTDAVVQARPEVVVHELTAIPRRVNPRRMEQDFALNDRLREEGTANLVGAARAAGARRVVAQSIAFAYAPDSNGGGGVRLRREEDPLFLDAPVSFRRSVQAVAALERAVLEAGDLEGVVLRYGYFYGPGTSYAPDGSMAEDVRRRRMPIAGGGRGVWSFIHIDDAAQATLLAVEGDTCGLYNVVDDDPAMVSEWLPAYAEAVGASRPRRLPGPLVRVVAGRYALFLMTRAMGASNERARRELGWTPQHASWRDGFRGSAGPSGS